MMKAAAVSGEGRKELHAKAAVASTPSGEKKSEKRRVRRRSLPKRSSSSTTRRGVTWS